jgi:hypothetical protein
MEREIQSITKPEWRVMLAHIEGALEGQRRFVIGSGSAFKEESIVLAEPPDLRKVLEKVRLDVSTTTPACGVIYKL